MNRLALLSASVCCVVLMACGSPQKRAEPKAAHVNIRERSGMCFLGASDPTINLENALNAAAQDALRNLFVGISPTEDRSAWVDIAQNLAGVQGNDQMIIARLKKNMAGGRVVGWWLDKKGVGPRGRCDGRCRHSTAWAVACLEGYEKDAPSLLPEAFRGRTPGWMRSAVSYRDHVCSLGFSGPTRTSEDAEGYAIENARYMVATTICGMGDHSFVDYMSGWGGTHDFPETRPSSSARQYVQSLAGTEREKLEVWLDKDGAGPLGNPGTAYARVCVPRVKIPCGGSVAE